MEIIELNFCGLNENIRRNIIFKGEKEFIEMNKAINKTFINQDNDEYENEIMDLGISTYEYMSQKNQK